MIYGTRDGIRYNAMTDAQGTSDVGERGGCGCKIGRAIREYGLSDLDDELAGRHGGAASLRDLEEYVNVHIVDAALQGADADVAGDAASVYAALAGEDVDIERRIAVEDQLADVGIDCARLEESFVTYQTVRRHLKDCLGVDTARNDGVESIEEARDVLADATDRYARIVTQVLRRLDRVDAITSGNPSANLSLRAVQVECSGCGAVRPLDAFLDEGCECRGDRV